MKIQFSSKLQFFSSRLQLLCAIVNIEFWTNGKIWREILKLKKRKKIYKISIGIAILELNTFNIDRKF